MTTSVSSLRSETGADAPRWNAEAARVLRETCRLYGPDLARNLSWWKRVREKGERFGVRDEDIAAAIRGLSRIVRVHPPWWPCRMFKRANAALWLEAMSAGRKLEARGPRPIGAILRELEREAR